MKNKIKRLFSAEFRQECVALVLAQNYSVSEAAKAMNIGKSTLSKWVNQVRTSDNEKSVKSVPITPDQQRIRELEKKIKRIEMENSILKKATALLMSDSLHNLN